MNKYALSLFVLFILIGSIFIISPISATKEKETYDNDISPITFSPLLKNRLSIASMLWNSLMGALPGEVPDEQSVLLEKINEYMGNASSVSNPIFAAGQVDKAIDAMKALGCSYSCDMASIMLTESDNDKTIPLNVGDVFVIELSENPSTGYSWDFAVSSGLSIVCDSFNPAVPEGDEMICGAPGIRRLTVLVTSEGTQTVKGAYVRPWESNGDAASTFIVTVV